MLLRVLVDVQVECQLGQVGAGVTDVEALTSKWTENHGTGAGHPGRGCRWRRKGTAQNPGASQMERAAQKGLCKDLLPAGVLDWRQAAFPPS